MRAELLVGPERRRRWSAEEKARIVAEALAPGAKVAEVARRHDVSRGLIYTWRRAAVGPQRDPTGSLCDGFGATLPDLVPVVVGGGGGSSPSTEVREQRRGSATAAAVGLQRGPTEGAIEVALPGDVRVTVRGRVEERMLRAVIRALRPA
jgi:transposase